LSHGKRAGNESKLRIRLAKKFHSKSAATVSNQKKGQQGPMGPVGTLSLPWLVLQGPKEKEQANALQPGFVQL
jgi:hypothetical protein